MAGEWTMAKGYGTSSEERQLELTLGLPGGGERSGVPVAREVVQNKEEVLSLGLFPKCPKSSSGSSAGGGKRGGFVDAEETDPPRGYEQAAPKVDQLDPLQQLGSGVVKAVPAPSADGAVVVSRAATTAPVVGWPPIRSFRKNIATSSRLPASHASKLAQKPHPTPAPENPNCCCSSPISISKGVFVKINMDGIPIGRKVDLKSCDGYEALSAKVDKLFRGLLMAAAQKQPLAASAPNSDEEMPVITGLLDGTGEYTLVYEDEEGDRILVGDVPWEMFVTTAKRLRILKTSDLSKLYLGATSRKRAAPEWCAGAC